MVVFSIIDGMGESGMWALLLIIVEVCWVDSMFGLCMEIQEWGDYVIIDGLFVMVFEFIFIVWIYFYGVQVEYIGIVIMESGLVVGFNFWLDMELGYYWLGGVWWWSSGFFVFVDEWLYVVLVVKFDGIIVYLNGELVIYIFFLEVVDFCNIVFFFGSYWGWV